MTNSRSVNTANGLAPWNGRDWDRAAAAHCLRRAGFGAGARELDEAVEAGFEATLARILEPPGHDAALLMGIEPLLATGSIEHLQAWWMALILGGGDPLGERMALLWHDHFATSNDKVQDVRLMHRQNAIFRRHGRGSFRTLLHEVSKDPAMLVWLDGDLNRRGQPNENFAREVLELFGLGIGHYTEDDIQEAARAFTGWGTEGRRYVYRAHDHDPGDKTVLGQSGDFGGEQVLELVLAHPACARHVARRLLEEFVGPGFADPDVQGLAAYLELEDLDLGAAIEHILRSALFHAPRSRRARIGSPVELVALSARALGASPVPREAAAAVADMGQALFRPPSVKGWDGGRAWIHAGSWIARHNFAHALARESDPNALDSSANHFDTLPVEDVARRVVAALLPEGATDELVRALEEAARAADDADEALVAVTALVLTAPEFHLV